MTMRICHGCSEIYEARGRDKFCKKCKEKSEKPENAASKPVNSYLDQHNNGEPTR